MEWEVEKKRYRAGGGRTHSHHRRILSPVGSGYNF